VLAVLLLEFDGVCPFVFRVGSAFGGGEVLDIVVLLVSAEADVGLLDLLLHLEARVERVSLLFEELGGLWLGGAGSGFDAELDFGEGQLDQLAHVLIL